MITYVKGEVGFDMPFQVLKSDGTPFNLSGYTLKLYFWKRNAASCVVNGTAMTIDVAAEGTCYYTVAAAALAESGYYEWIIEMTCGGATRKAYGHDYIRVRESQPT